ncbi:malate/lactate/ureidoglycolate dehydrogenase [Sediminicoccus sp. KRV36]|uniref:malate/lactate/ureidoglycolate dehydrogenase n=1 Tax=Sediminicoccus sp. KRV36 TaxID=3133721 RepID=UPI00200E92BE|nr:malate/lactate/ureidoglycolate dehydrogenase [Sediminicoccus rosea]UPY34939.1 malate/lactate/ureidoglycolate dehydrogenase [Sediminicoccus rosea]
MPQIAHDALIQLVAEMLRRVGAEPPIAQQVAADLVEANLQGHDSHGMQLVPRYVENTEKQLITPNALAEQVGGAGSLAVWDGRMGYGQCIGRQVTAAGIAAAREHGLAGFGLRNTHHLGRIGAYAEMAVAQGMIGIFFVNAVSGRPVVAPFGGTDGRMGTNPICIGIPKSPDPIILDFATSAIAVGKVKVAFNAGKPVPPGALVTHEGESSTDAAVMYGQGPRGALLSFGAHKGYGLALVCEILAGALTGGGTNQPATPNDRGIVNGMMGILLDPARLAENPGFAAEVQAICDHVQASAPGQVLLPGDPERRAKAQRMANGIPLDDVTWGDLSACASRLGIAEAAIRAVLL